jgi:hypothetical protein
MTEPTCGTIDGEWIDGAAFQTWEEAAPASRTLKAFAPSSWPQRVDSSDGNEATADRSIASLTERSGSTSTCVSGRQGGSARVP